jgi:replicative DNA helicase
MSSADNQTELYSKNIEAAILSTIIFDEQAREQIINSVTDEDFFIPSHKQLISIMQKLAEEELPVDEAFIQPEFSKVNKNWEMEFLEVLSANPLSNIDAYIELLKTLTQKRKLYDMSLQIRKLLTDDKSPIDMIQDVERMLTSVEDVVDTKTSTRTMSDIVDEIEEDMRKAQSGEKTPFFKTGYINFDSYAGGFVENGLTVVAARPSMGKSSFTSGPIVSTLERGEAAILYSMEVVDKNALLRLISFKSQEPLSGLKIGSLRDYESYRHAKEFFIGSNNNFSIIDRSGMSKKDLEIDIVKRLRENPNIKVIIIDHLLQMHIDSKKHAPTELGDITKMLKGIAQNFKVSVVLLSQLNRSVESRENKRPMMADLQGSGSIEQDADMIVFLYRPEYYKEKEWNSEEQGEYQRPDIEHAEAIIGKNRDGPTGSVELGFRAKTASFLNDGSPIETIDYIDDDYGQNVDSKASTQDSSDTIQQGGIDMPLI